MFPTAPWGPASPAPGLFRFDESRARRVVNFIERLIVHTKGRHARQPFVLTGWQRDEIIRPLYGTVALNDQYGEWVRQYRIGWLEMARKNGKSEESPHNVMIGGFTARVDRERLPIQDLASRPV